MRSPRVPFVAFAMALATTAACHRHLDLGSHPQLLGKLSTIDLDMSEVEMKSRVPELADTDSKELTTIEYSAYFDRKHQLEDVLVRVAQPIDDLLAAWGPGEPGGYGSEPARIYADPKKGIRFAVRLNSNAPTGNSFTVIAVPMRPLATMLDDGPDSKVFGVDLVGSTLDQVRSQLTKQGVPTEPWSVDPDVAQVLHTEIVESVGHPNTEYGGFTVRLAAYQDSHVIKRVELAFELGERDDTERALLDLFAHKWGTPTREGSTLTYSAKDHAISVTLLGLRAELAIAEPPASSP